GRNEDRRLPHFGEELRMGELAEMLNRVERGFIRLTRCAGRAGDPNRPPKRGRGGAECCEVLALVPEPAGGQDAGLLHRRWIRKRASVPDGAAAKRRAVGRFDPAAESGGRR